ncbi:NosD domain-containing protein [Candidatus Lokiarchaeum ossiferum]|uniref:NosD domain-containing protein n=1 Tax=Candidatus Lokiarchaeum ossiferum TaxID=2951803 RepID=UPI00352DD758
MKTIKSSNNIFIIILTALMMGSVIISYSTLHFSEEINSNSPEAHDFDIIANSGTLQILNDTALAGNSVSGNGSLASPYILENLIIDAKTSGNGLHIENTRQYLKIQNSTFLFSQLSSSYAGIFLKNCSNIFFDKILCVGNYFGIYIENSTNFSGSNLEIWNNEYAGICMKDSADIIFSAVSIAKGQYGHYISSTNNLTITHSEIHFSSAGIDATDSTDLNFSHILFDETVRRGVDLDGCVDVEMKFNDFFRCDNSKYGSSMGIYSAESQNITMRNNTFTDCYVGTSFNSGPALIEMQHDIDESNLINGLPIGYIHDDEYLDASVFHGKSQLIIVNVNHTIIAHLDFNHFPYPISLYYCKNLTIQDSSITNAIYPLYFCKSNNCTVVNNEIKDCAQYLGYFVECSNFKISKNTFENTSKNAIYLKDTEYFSISQNTIKFSSAAIYSYSSEHTMIQNNNMDNNRYGFSCYNFINLTIYNNFINSSSYDLDFYQTCVSILNISKNEMYGKGIIFPEAIGQTVFSSYTIENNTIHGKPIYCYYSESGLTPNDFQNAGQIFVVDCSSIQIEDLAINEMAVGLFIIYSTDVYISNITVTTATKFGILLSNGQNALIENCSVTTSDIGIFCRGDNMNSIENFSVVNNVIKDAYEGIRFDYVNVLNISNNHLEDISESGIVVRNWGFGDIAQNLIKVDGGTAIELIRCEELNFTHNTMIGSGFEFELYGGSSLEYFDSHLIPTSNTVNSKPVYYYCHQSGLLPHNFTNGGQVILIDCEDSEIAHLDLSYNHYGLFASSCYNLTLSNITVSHCSDYGLYFQETQFCSLRHINATYNHGGIQFKGGTGIYYPNNTISESNICHNEGNGCYFSYSYNFTIITSTICNNSDGIHPSSSQYARVINTTLNANQRAIHDYYSHNLTISGCSFTNNIEGALKYQAKDLKFSNNTMVNGGLCLAHYNLADVTTFEISGDNWINGKKLYFYKNCANLASSNFTNAGQIILYNVANVSITDVNLSNATCGFYLIASHNISLINVESSNNVEFGGHCCDSQELWMENCEYSSNNDGLLFDSCTSVNLNSITFKNNLYQGIYGDHLSNSNISNSTFEKNEGKGVNLQYSHNNTFTSNNFLNNFIAVQLGDSESNLNLFWNNSFVGESMLVSDLGLLNIYYQGSIGNFWSDYEIRYPDAVAIGDHWDISYLIMGSFCTYDRFPLIFDPFDNAVSDDTTNSTTDSTSSVDTSSTSTSTNTGSERPMSEILVYSITGGVLGVCLIGAVVYRVKLLKK